MGKLDERVAVITGAASGIGAATARRMAQEGASVVVADIDGKGADERAAEITESGGRAVGVQADVADEQSVRSMIRTAVERFGRLDILHNNAAIFTPEVLGRDLDVVSVDMATWDTVMGVNLKGAVLGCKYAIPEMLRNKRGSIINTASTAAVVGETDRVAYGCSKAALVSLARHVATAYGKHGIRANAIAPSVMVTPLNRSSMTPDFLDNIERTVLTPRLGEPEDVANLVTFLASDDAAFITGQLVLIDGGMLSHFPTGWPGKYAVRW